LEYRFKIFRVGWGDRVGQIAVLQEKEACCEKVAPPTFLRKGRHRKQQIKTESPYYDAATENTQ
jgi:hypothetical protein